MKRKLKAIELFAGAGGMALGLQQAGLNVVAAVEIDKWCCTTLKANKRHAFPKMKIISADITTLSGESLLEKVGLAKGQLDVLSGGPPCQAFSTANPNRSTRDPRSRLMWEFIRMVDEIQPRYFVIENVRGLLSFKNFFRLLLKTLEQCGYVVRFNLMDAVSYGVPQRRLRVFIEGTRNDLDIIPEFPSPTHFDLDKKAEENSIPESLVAVKCFATHGFTRTEVDDVWFNPKLEIMMNRKSATEKIEQAVREILLEAILNPRRKGIQGIDEVIR
jgi:DNA (cytosine-5)-methyltransferase 1